MKITTLMLFVSMMSVSAAGLAQKITFSVKGERLEKVLTQIRKQSGYDIVYNASEIRKAKPVTLNLQGVSLEKALEESLKNQDLEYTFSDQIVMIKAKEPSFLEKVVDALTPPVDVRGVVLDEKGMPLPGATVKVKGLKQSVVTDKDGKFYLPGVDDEAVLVISYVGYADKEVSAKAEVSVALEIKSDELQEVVVAYGKQEQRAITGAVQVVKGSEIQNIPNRSFDKSLQGLVPGLLVTSGSGQPGSGLSNFVLRGISTSGSIEYGGASVRSPLIVIDGIPVTQDNSQLYISDKATPINNPLAQLNPSNIESLSVLKDASAIALYGAKASNGVILITTKMGRSGKTKFSFRHQTDISSPLDGSENMVSSDQYLDLIYETYRNSPKVENGVTTPWTNDAITEMLKEKFPVRSSDNSFYPATNWVDALYKKHAMTYSNELSISGGGATNSFFLNLESTNQKGTVKGTGYDRQSIRFNFDNRPSDWLKFGFKSELSYNVQKYGGALNGSGDSYAGAPGSLYISPLNPVRLENGDFYQVLKEGGLYSNQVNPVAMQEYNSNGNTAFRGLSKLFTEVNIIKGLKLTTNLGADFMLAEAREYADPRLIDITLNQSGGRIQEQNLRMSNLINTNTVNYTTAISDDHNVSVLVGQESQIQFRKLLNVGVTGLKSPYYDQISSPGVSAIGLPQGYALKETLASYFGQLNYAYKQKYYLSSSIRRDGSSRFGADRKYGTYWSTGLGWVISNEDFIKSASWIDYLKIRGSIGAAGNAGAINRFTPYDPVSISTYGGASAVLLNSARAGNSNVHWEQTFTWDAGLEAKLFGGRIAATADIYTKKTSDLIYEVNVPFYTGFQTTLANVGEMQNRGVELSLAGDILRTKNFSWNSNINWSTNRNKLLKADVPEASLQDPSGILGNKVGENFGSFYLVRWAGVNQQDGEPQWLDKDGNTVKGYANYPWEGKVLAGKPQPDGFGAFTNTFKFKSVDLTCMLYYQYGYKIYNADLFEDGNNVFRNKTKLSLDRWQNPGDIASNPKRTLNNPSTGVSTRYLSDGSHIRLQNVMLGCTLPDALVKRLHMSSLRVFVQGNNLALWMRQTGNDPGNTNAVGANNVTYPVQQSYSLGLNLNF